MLNENRREDRPESQTATLPETVVPASEMTDYNIPVNTPPESAVNYLPKLAGTEATAKPASE